MNELSIIILNVKINKCRIHFFHLKISFQKIFEFENSSIIFIQKTIQLKLIG